MKAALIQILMGAIGTLGFSIYFRVSERNVAAATFGGALGWGVYLLCFHLWGNVFAANVVATAVVYFWSVAMARVLKAPSNTYLIPGIIPLLPGGPLLSTIYTDCTAPWGRTITLATHSKTATSNTAPKRMANMQRP